MPCQISCGISAIFLSGMVYMSYATYQSDIMNKYKNQLPENLQKTYTTDIETCKGLNKIIEKTKSLSNNFSKMI